VPEVVDRVVALPAAGLRVVAGLLVVAGLRVEDARLGAGFAAAGLVVDAAGVAEVDAAVDAPAAPAAVGRLTDPGLAAVFGPDDADAVALRAVASFPVAAGLAAVRVAVRAAVFEAPLKAVARFRVARLEEAAVVLSNKLDAFTGETAPAAWIAADPTRFTASPTAPPTSTAAEPATEAVTAAAFDKSDATSLASSAACRWRLATSLRPFEPCAAASCPRRLVSVARAAARRFSSWRSSFAAFSRLPIRSTSLPPCGKRRPWRAGRQVCHVPMGARSRHPDVTR
jgi:hypothetical protein